MERSMVRTVVFAGLILFGAASARADSDGYFCVGPGYVAYERAGVAPPHILLVVRVGASGISETQRVALERFQTHGMKCGGGIVTLQSFDALYEVDLTKATVKKQTRDAPGGALPGFDTRNLGNLSKPDVVVIPTPKGAPRFEIVTTKLEKTVKGGVERYSFAHLVRRDGESIVATKQLFAGLFLETVD